MLKADVDVVKEGTSFGWVIGTTGITGHLPGVRRGVGTVQKDWTIIKSNALPNDLCIAVRGHRGWSRDPESAATSRWPSALKSSARRFRFTSRSGPAVLELQSEIEVESEAEIEIEERWRSVTATGNDSILVFHEES